MLAKLGARIQGTGSNTLLIDGVSRLSGGEFSAGPDYMEVGSYIALAAMTGGSILIKGAGTRALRMVRLVFGRLGVSSRREGRTCTFPLPSPCRSSPILAARSRPSPTHRGPGSPPDLMSIAIVLATQSPGTVLVHEKMFESRLYFVDKLIMMGARIILCDPHRCVVQGRSRLHGDEVESPDIRAGMALVSAALCAEGESVIRNICQIDRGYEGVDEKLRSLGARMRRAED